ncbi:hypothetical protein B0H14DRAFT_2619364 [Mycena olivaceomarginata]|nr:hypothetical protein B0H14DRAFT_2619364 [Mycena olivaceomarginata]
MRGDAEDERSQNSIGCILTAVTIQATRGQVRFFLVADLLMDTWGCWGQEIPNSIGCILTAAAIQASRGRVWFFLVADLLMDAWGCWGQEIPEFHLVHPDGGRHSVPAVNNALHSRSPTYD